MGTDHRGRSTGNNHRPTPRLLNAISEHLGVSDSQAEDLVNAHRAGRIEDVYGGSSWDGSPEETDLQNRVTKSGGVKEALEGSIHHYRMARQYGPEWFYNPESSWSKRG